VKFELASGKALTTPVATFNIWVILWSLNPWRLWAPSWEEMYRLSTTWWILSSGLVLTHSAAAPAKICSWSHELWWYIHERSCKFMNSSCSVHQIFSYGSWTSVHEVFIEFTWWTYHEIFLNLYWFMNVHDFVWWTTMNFSWTVLVDYNTS
jgi:hypothetical protein